MGLICFTLITNEVEMTFYMFMVHFCMFVVLLCQISANVFCPFLKLGCLFILEV